QERTLSRSTDRTLSRSGSVRAGSPGTASEDCCAPRVTSSSSLETALGMGGRLTRQLSFDGLSTQASDHAMVVPTSSQLSSRPRGRQAAGESPVSGVEWQDFSLRSSSRGASEVESERVSEDPGTGLGHVEGGEDLVAAPLPAAAASSIADVTHAPGPGLRWCLFQQASLLAVLQVA
ncbi:unnamed protein product, partial [Amoebophrya sp. A120]